MMFVELLLKWEAYLCEERMKITHVKRLDWKMRYLMYVMKIVAARTQGMGLKLMKFHVVIHLFHDILQYGIPKEVDTGSNESHHKPMKGAAKNTQKHEATFTLQTATRMDELKLVMYATAELRGLQMSHYYHGVAAPPPEEKKARAGRAASEVSYLDASEGSHLDGEVAETASKDSDPLPISTYGSRIKVFWDEEAAHPAHKLITRRKKRSTHGILLWFLFFLISKAKLELHLGTEPSPFLQNTSVEARYSVATQNSEAMAQGKTGSKWIGEIMVSCAHRSGALWWWKIWMRVPESIMVVQGCKMVYLRSQRAVTFARRRRILEWRTSFCPWTKKWWRMRMAIG